MFTTRPRSTTLLVAGTLLIAFGVAGCSNNTPETPATVVTTVPAPAATPPAGATAVTTPTGPDTKINVNAGPGTSQGTDEATGEAINKAVVTNKQMTGSRVEAVVTGGVATLTGSVQNAQQKALAEKAAHDTTGVSSVKDKIQINPTGGAKAPPVTKTKIVVIHDNAPASPAPVAAPAPPAAGSSDGAGTTGNGTTTAPPADSGSTPGAATPPAAGTGQ